MGTGLAILVAQKLSFWWRKTCNPSGKFQNLRYKGQKSRIWGFATRVFTKFYENFAQNFRDFGALLPEFRNFFQFSAHTKIYYFFNRLTFVHYFRFSLHFSFQFFHFLFSVTSLRVFFFFSFLYFSFIIIFLVIKVSIYKIARGAKGAAEGAGTKAPAPKKGLGDVVLSQGRLQK